MNDQITVMGFVGNDPVERLTADGRPRTSFRMATSGRRYDRKTESWVDKESNWYTITSFGVLAQNVSASVEKGQPVLVRGRLEVRSWTSQERSGTSVEIVAAHIGHDLGLGTARFSKTFGAGRDQQAGETAGPAPTGDAARPESGEGPPADHASRTSGPSASAGDPPF